MLKFSNSLSFANVKQLPTVIALYAVYSKGNIIYIGTAIGLKRRFKSHHHMNDFIEMQADEIKWNTYSHLNRDSLIEDEVKAIEEIKPILNGRSTNTRTKKQRYKGQLEPSYTPVEYYLDTLFQSESKLHKITLILLFKKFDEYGSKIFILDKIAEETELTFSWLESFARGYCGSPAVDKVEKLYEWLTGKPLTLAA